MRVWPLSGSQREGSRVRTFATRTGVRLPLLGQGTWEMGAADRASEVAALRLGFDLGLVLVDTAEMYAHGGAEEVVGAAIQGRREEVFLVSKVLPGNASRLGTIAAAERSLRRLKTDCIDLYLLHWAGPHPLRATLEAFQQLREQGKIRDYGVSNFDVDEMVAAEESPHGSGVCANQVFYNLGRRGIERRLMPWCIDRGIAIMAYSPLEQGRLRETKSLRRVAARHGVTPAQVALAWTLRVDGVVTLVKAARAEHVRENAAAADIALSADDLAELDAEFPRPQRDVPLDTL
ncbi:MAG: aldo/keto reductase [Candidatus Latescibacterota bacterium]|nr:MAG: aldo/keto reductase [Candidatus Latescibacterota bacterium]